MKKTIKLTALILSVLCILLFAACGRQKAEEEDIHPDDESILVPPAAAPIELNNGLICEVGMASVSVEFPEDIISKVRIYSDRTVEVTAVMKSDVDTCLAWPKRYKISDEAMEELLENLNFIAGHSYYYSEFYGDLSEIEDFIGYVTIFSEGREYIRTTYAAGYVSGERYGEFDMVETLIGSMNENIAPYSITEPLVYTAGSAMLARDHDGLSFEKIVCRYFDRYDSYTLYPDRRLEVRSLTDETELVREYVLDEARYWDLYISIFEEIDYSRLEKERNENDPIRMEFFDKEGEYVCTLGEGNNYDFYNVELSLNKIMSEE